MEGSVLIQNIVQLYGFVVISNGYVVYWRICNSRRLLWTILYCCNDCMSWESEMLVQILFELAETIRCYQWHTIITSKSVFRSTSEISTRSNTIHHEHNTVGRNSTEISAKFPSLCWWDTAVHVIQAEQCGIITPNHQQHPKLCHWHQVLDDG